MRDELARFSIQSSVSAWCIHSAAFQRPVRRDHFANENPRKLLSRGQVLHLYDRVEKTFKISISFLFPRNFARPFTGHECTTLICRRFELTPRHHQCARPLVKAGNITGSNDIASVNRSICVDRENKSHDTVGALRLGRLRKIFMPNPSSWLDRHWSSTLIVTGGRLGQKRRRDDKRADAAEISLHCRHAPHQSRWQRLPDLLRVRHRANRVHERLR